MEKINNNMTTSLICSTPITETKNLTFIWYKNEQIIFKNNSDFEQIINKPLSNDKNALYMSELKFKSNPKQLNGFYTCSLIFSEDFFNIIRNESIIFKPKCNFNF